MFKRILIPTDGSEVTVKAVSMSIAIAQSVGAQLYVISVKEPFPYNALSEMQPAPPQEYFEAQETLARARVAHVAELSQAAGVSCHTHTVEALSPWEAIVEYAEKMECDLLVMGSHGRGGVSALLLGSQTQKVLAHSKLPVLVVR
jgi:nucleotide-binding universal stress UspA family protein